MSKTYIIDGNSLLFRAFYALFRPGVELMHSKDGTPTNAIYSFKNMMQKIKSELSDNDKMIVCFDTDSKTFRSKELETYKKNRKPLEPALKVQLPLARKLLDAMGIFYYELPGYEGDDIAGSLAKYAAKLGDEVTLFTSDKDFLQLLDDNIVVKFLRKGLSEIELFTKDNIYEKLGFRADQVTDYKGLVGDTSDNFKGIPGIGEKTAVKLLNEYGHLEEIIIGMQSLNTKAAKNIVENAELGRFCKHIATIITDMPNIYEVYDKGQVKDFNYLELRAFYKKYDLYKFYKELEDEMKKREGEQMSLDFDEERLEAYSNFEFVETQKNKNSYSIKELTTLKDIDVSSVVVSFSGENPHNGTIDCFYLSNGKEIFYISKDNAIKDDYFKTYLVSPKQKSTYNLKALIVIANRLGLPTPIGFDFDLLLATYLIDADVESEPKAILNCYGINDETLPAYALLSLKSVELKDSVLNKLKELEEIDLFEKVEMPLTKVLATMEIEGFPIDKETLAKINEQYKERLTKTKDKIIQYIGHEINLNSPKQVGALLFEELGLTNPKSKKSTSTSFEVLNAMKNQHPIIELLIDYRKINKSISSYTESLPQHIFSDGKIHAMFNQALTTTGRLSMSEPNLQNISIRNEESKEIRKAFFYPNNEFYIMSFDYSQIELRMIASLANVTQLLDAFNSDVDIHTTTASVVFHVPLNEVTHDMRRKAKAVNFGIVYGISSYGLAEQLEISRTEAKEIMDNFHRTFTGLEEYNNNVINFAKSHEYVTTILNRRRYLKDINSENHTLRAFSERAAINTTVQGSAADLIKVAMIKIDEMLKNYKTKMVLQIHDELIFKVPKDEKGIIEDKIIEIMENALKLKCRLKVEGSSAFCWYDAK